MRISGNHIPHTNSVEQLTDAQNRKGVGLRLSQHRGNPQPTGKKKGHAVQKKVRLQQRLQR